MRKKSVDILFIYEVKPRELENVCLLACEMEKRGYTTQILNSWELLKKQNITQYSCVTLVLSACYNDDVFRFFTGFVHDFKNVICLQWEQIPVNYSYRATQANSWTYQGVAKKIRNICWGEAERERLVEKFGMDPQYVRITGYITLDFYRDQFRQMIVAKEKLFKKYGLELHKKTCLFVSSFVYIRLPSELEAVADETGKALTKKISLLSQKKLLNWIERLLSESPDLQFIYRPHPSEADNPELKHLERRLKGFFCISQMAVKHWICASDRVYIWNSTVAVEALESGVATYLLRPVKMPQICDMPVFDSCNSIETYGEFRLSALRETTTGKLDRQTMARWYLWDEKTPAYTKICDWLEETYHDRSYRVSRQHLDKDISRLQMWWEYRISYPFNNVFLHHIRYWILYGARRWLNRARPVRPERTGKVLYIGYTVLWRFENWIGGILAKGGFPGAILLRNQKVNQWALNAQRQNEEVRQEKEKERERWRQEKETIRRMQKKLTEELKHYRSGEDARQKQSYDRSKYKMNRARAAEIKQLKKRLKECLADISGRTEENVC